MRSGMPVPKLAAFSGVRMSNADHLELLVELGREWNTWRRANPNVQPDLSATDFSNREFPREMNFRFVDFSRCDFTAAYVPGADFYGANLIGAKLEKLDAVGVSVSNIKANGADFTSGIPLRQLYVR